MSPTRAGRMREKVVRQLAAETAGTTPTSLPSKRSSRTIEPEADCATNSFPVSPKIAVQYPISAGHVAIHRRHSAPSKQYRFARPGSKPKGCSRT